MHHLASLRLKDPAHDVDRGVVPVEQARGGDEADRMRRLVHGDPPSLDDVLGMVDLF
jgi:hypothetical protein